MKTDTIFLIGFMGTGKTAAGTELARILGRKFIDTDKLIEENCAMSVAEIFEKKGEQAFRQMESDILGAISKQTPCVVSTGGGMVAHNNNLMRMKEIGTTISLTACPQEILRRVSVSEETRPLLKSGDLLLKIISLLQKRAYYYIMSDIMIVTDGKSPVEVALEIKERLHL